MIGRRRFNTGWLSLWQESLTIQKSRSGLASLLNRAPGPDVGVRPKRDRRTLEAMQPGPLDHVASRVRPHLHRSFQRAAMPGCLALWSCFARLLHSQRWMMVA